MEVLLGPSWPWKNPSPFQKQCALVGESSQSGWEVQNLCRHRYVHSMAYSQRG